MSEEHPPYTTTYFSVSGLKAVLMSWEEELGTYAPWMTGPTFKDPEHSRQWAKDWAGAEEIEYIT